MTFGIDIATPQANIDLNRAKREGVEFVIVKMGGLNVTPMYVSPYYRRQISQAIAAGLCKGHYWLIGRGESPRSQAEYFVRNLYRFDKDHDVLALDNEDLDSNGTRWGDAAAAEFINRVVELTGIDRNRVWHYAGAHDYRSVSNWPRVEASGARFWWAAYGSFPTGHYPDHTPSLQGSIPRADVHQYSSRVRVAGYNLDGDYSSISCDTLFGKTAIADVDVKPLPAPIPIPVPEPKRKNKEKNMLLAKIEKGGPNGKSDLWILFGETYHEFTGDAAGKALEEQIGAPAALVSRGWAEEQKAAQNKVAQVKLPTTSMEPWYEEPEKETTE